MLTLMALMALGTLLLVALPLMLMFALVGIVLRGVFWLLFLPLKLLFLPFRLLGWVFRVGIGLLLLPVLLVGGLIVAIVAIIGGLLSIVVPLIPLALIALAGWAIYKASRRAPAVNGF